MRNRSKRSAEEEASNIKGIRVARGQPISWRSGHLAPIRFVAAFLPAHACDSRQTKPARPEGLLGARDGSDDLDAKDDALALAAAA
jgi:hypothetical protein